MHLDLSQSLSLCGDAATPNDDRAGASARHAWVIDGATDLSPPGLVGAYGASDAAGLFAAVRADGLAALGQELRAIECADAACVRFARDDATALWVRVAR